MSLYYESKLVEIQNRVPERIWKVGSEIGNIHALGDRYFKRRSLEDPNFIEKYNQLLTEQEEHNSNSYIKRTKLEFDVRHDRWIQNLLLGWAVSGGACLYGGGGALVAIIDSKIFKPVRDSEKKK